MPIPFRNFRKPKPRFMARKCKLPHHLISHFEHHNPAYLLHKSRENNRKTHKTKPESKINRPAPPFSNLHFPIPHTKTNQTNTTFNISEHENSISQPYMTVFKTKIPPFRTPIYQFPPTRPPFSNPDFPNFTKHSTVLTSILQQINTLYQHFPSAKTAKPKLEQAKTMLKIALPTFKNDENHTQNSKILCGNGKMVV